MWEWQVSRRLRLTKFREISPDDPFFSDLKDSYKEFPDWFAGKADEDLYVIDDDDELSGMLYLKRENGRVTDVKPALPSRRWLKVGTLKVVGRGTKMGERLIKKIFDTALSSNANAIYVTVFSVHKTLLDLIKRYGFEHVAEKKTQNGVELVLARYLTDLSGDMITDYPFIHCANRKFWLLAIYPDYHTRLLPDSILNNEPKEIVQDVSHTNTIHKVYIAGLALARMSKGDVVVFYRTTDHKAPARYRSVVTSLCVVEETRRKRDFKSVEDFLSYTMPRSVFTEEELRQKFLSMKRLSVAKMTYNAAFGRRTTRGQLLDAEVLSLQPRWDLRELNRQQFDQIVQMGEVNARIIVD